MNMFDIHTAISTRFSQHKYRLFNSYVFMWESDYFSVTQDEKFIYEVEVKLSLSDFFADFKKNEKHRYLSEAMRNNKTMTLHTSTITEHTNGAKVEYSPLHFRNPQEYTPNRFYYCCPDGMIKKEELPEYAGLLYLNETGTSARQVKTAPIIHKNKNVPKYTKTLVDKFYFQYQNMRQEYQIAKYNIKELNSLRDENHNLRNKLYIKENVGFIEEIDRLKKELEREHKRCDAVIRENHKLNKELGFNRK